MVNCCIGTKSTKSCCIETKRPKLSPAAGDLFDGLQSNLIDHMVCGEPKKFPWSMETISMVSKMQKSAHGLKCTKTMVSPGFIRCADAGDQGVKTQAVKVCGDAGVKV